MSLSAVFLALLLNANLQTVPEGGAVEEVAEAQSQSEVYERDFFARFNPQTARDMIERLPGFSLDAGENVRGFGGAAGNILIDGNRPSSKVGVLDALGRIPANSVARIELIRGTAGSSEAAGQTVVANIIRESSDGTGSWQVELERAADGRLYPALDLTMVNSVGGWQTSTNVNAYWERFPLTGTRTTENANGQLLLSQLEHRPSVLAEAFVSTEASRPLLDGDLTLTGRYGYSGFLPDTHRLIFDNRLPVGNPDERFLIDFDSEYLEGELGVDWTRPLTDAWSGKILALTYFQDLDQTQILSSERPLGIVSSASEFVRLQDKFETVLRATMSRTGDVEFRPEFGAEIAFNSLDSTLSLTSGPPGSQTSVTLPAANVTIEELRGEAFANLIWQASARWSVEGGMAAEYSEISVSGDAANSQSFFFLKPSASVIYAPREGVQFRLGAERTVGQLDFSAFAASASASDDRLLAGNPDLGPDQTTRLSTAIDIRAEGGAAFNAELFHEWRDDLIEQIILPSGSAGAGNAGDGRFWGVEINGSLPLGALFEGGLLEAEVGVRESSFLDPVSGLEREISGTLSPRFAVEFRQDLVEQQLAWGASYANATDQTYFYADEESFSRDGETWTVFVETTRIQGLRTNLTFQNIGGQDFHRERRLFTPDRSAALSELETIRQERGMFVSLTVSGQF
ncbi:outer membrane beta-barrel protein [Hyphobacterium sp. CCMP332]|uniref:TonB-dependent receptor plug domain-containing protein n=1 Tax=Hyphobacterium sp. CCMP332 TaxID=2749086 RepID=UPI0016507A39|nr:TonB-dependent receptor [Hyphobacterium sp. CCMP332]QNL19494.1 outer membrane beta-barrel protein [Hyphobacterium sp. CCMP332]